MAKSKLTGIEKILELAAQEHDKAIAREDYSESNTKCGYYNGAFDCKKYRGTDAEKYNHGFAEWCLNGSVEKADWGKAAYWRAYLNGWMVADSALRIEELTNQDAS